MPSFAGPGGRVTTVSTSGGLTENGRLLQELERIKLEQAIAAARSGKPAPAAAATPASVARAGSSSQDLAAQLANRVQLQREAAGSQAALQTQRLQVGSQDLATQLANRVQLQREAAGSQAALQTQRLQVGSQDLAAQLANRVQLQRENNSSQATLQERRLQVGSQDLASQLANRVQLQREGSSLKQQEMKLDSTLDEDRKKDAAARALALFRATPGGGPAKLNTKAARAELA